MYSAAHKYSYLSHHFISEIRLLGKNTLKQSRSQLPKLAELMCSILNIFMDTEIFCCMSWKKLKSFPVIKKFNVETTLRAKLFLRIRYYPYQRSHNVIPSHFVKVRLGWTFTESMRTVYNELCLMVQLCIIVYLKDSGVTRTVRKNDKIRSS